MKLNLLKGLSQDEELEFREDYIKALRFRKRLKEVLESDIEALHNSMRNEDNFEANWPYFQAKKLGEVASLLRVINMLEEKK